MNHYDEIRQVEELGERIGYGNMMSIASAIWAHKMGYKPDCAWSVSTALDFVKDEYKGAVKQEIAVERSWVDKYFKEKSSEN